MAAWAPMGNRLAYMLLTACAIFALTGFLGVALTDLVP